MTEQNTSKQWAAFVNIVKAARLNKNYDSKKKILKTLSEVEVKKGSGFVENSLKGSVVKCMLMLPEDTYVNLSLSSE